MGMGLFKLSIPRIGSHIGSEAGDILDVLLAEFDWKFGEMVGQSHPTTTGNCRGHGIAAGGNTEAGFYNNASMSCRHCYPGSNPARLEWGKEELTLHCDVRSGKLIRAVAAFHRLNYTQVCVGLEVDYSELPYFRESAVGHRC